MPDLHSAAVCSGLVHCYYSDPDQRSAVRYCLYLNHRSALHRQSQHRLPAAANLPVWNRLPAAAHLPVWNRLPASVLLPVPLPDFLTDPLLLYQILPMRIHL